MINVVLYTSSTDSGTEDLRKLLDSLQAMYPHKLVEVNIDQDAKLYQGYFSKTPVLEVGPYHLYSPFSEADLKMTLGAAKDRHESLTKAQNADYLKKVEKGKTITQSDRFSMWLTSNYIWIFNLFLLIFVGLPFIAPLLERAGAKLPATIIYKIYSPLCHQLAFRSWFLYGEQSAYPRELAEQPGLNYEQISGKNSLDVLYARNFVGDEHLGYKVALCERDIAIYGGILLFGVIFALTGNKMKSLPWYFWIILGIIPMGIDGVTQLPGLMSLNISWLPVRESTPLLRTMTGLLFGVTTAWYGYPLIEETMRDSKKTLIKKFAVSALDK